MEMELFRSANTRNLNADTKTETKLDTKVDTKVRTLRKVSLFLEKGENTPARTSN